MKPVLKWVAAAALTASAFGAQAALQARAGGMVYDDVQDITWLADFNLAQSSGVSATGAMVWSEANAWANNLTYGGHSDWRLPSAYNADGSGPCEGWNCTGSELGHLYHVDWGASPNPFDGGVASAANPSNVSLFSNIQGNYWSSEYATNPGGAWIFSPSNGQQWNFTQNTLLHGVAVRDGDVMAAVPEPQTYALLLAGLGLLTLVRRKTR